MRPLAPPRRSVRRWLRHLPLFLTALTFLSLGSTRYLGPAVMATSDVASEFDDIEGTPGRVEGERRPYRPAQGVSSGDPVKLKQNNQHIIHIEYCTS